MDIDGNGSLHDDLRHMLLDKSYSDIVFVCGEEKTEVPALRALVAARSSPLNAMLLTAGMVETKLSCITLPDIDGTTMHICLEFFYTDTVQLSSWPSNETLPRNETFMKVIAAAKFFLVPKLEQLAISHFTSIMIRLFSESYSLFSRKNRARPREGEFDLPLLVDLIRAYNRGVTLHHAHSDIKFKKLLMAITNYIELHGLWPLECYKLLSAQGLVHLLQNVDADGPDDNFHINEYCKFIHVVRFCLSKVTLGSDDDINEQKLLEDIIDRYLPWPSVDLFDRLSEFFSDNKLVPDARSIRNLELLREEVAKCLEYAHVDFFKISSAFLCKIIEPLNMIPCSILLGAYRIQALNKLELRWDYYGHSRETRASLNMTRIEAEEQAEFKGFARCSTGFGVSRVLACQWEIVIVTPCEQIRIGFLKHRSFSTSESYNENLLGDQEFSWGLGSDGFLYWSNGGSRGRHYYCDAFPIHEDLRVGVHLNIKCCSFSINGKNLGDAHIPGWPICDILYPAISLEHLGIVEVQMPVEDWMRDEKSKVTRRF